MATLITRYVNLASSAGGDGTTSGTSGSTRAYASLYDALVAQYGVRPNLVTADEQLRIVCIGAGFDTDGSGGNAQVDMADAPFTTDATRNLIIEVDAGSQHPGFYSTSKYGIDGGTTNWTVVADAPNHTVFRGLQFTTAADNYGYAAQNVNVHKVTFERCVFHFRHTGSPTATRGVYLNGPLDGSTARSVTMVNCVGSGKISSLLYLNYPMAGTAIVYNNTVVGATGVGIATNQAVSGTTLYLKNNIVEHAGSGECYRVNDATVTSATNISSDSTSPQSALRNTTLAYDDPSSFNYALDAGDTEAIDAGTNLSADAQFAFSTDITGATRSGAWEIGAFGFATTGGSSTFLFHSEASMDDIRQKGATNQSVEVFFRDDATGLGKTGLVTGSAMAISYYRPGASAATAITLSNLGTLSAAHSDGGVKEVGGGWYRLDLPDAVLASGADRARLFGSATDAVMDPVSIVITDFDPVAEGVFTSEQAELTSAPPVSNVAPVDMLRWVYHSLRNARITTATADTLKRGDETTTLATATLSDTSGTFTRGEYV